MASRWLHTPTLHSPHAGHERRVGWLELFYDLVYVAAFIQLGNALSANVAVDGFLAFAGLMVPLWLTWTAFTFYTNRFVVDDAVHRGLVFLQMFTVAGMAVCVPDVLEHDARAFALFYAGGRAVLAIMYLRAWRQETHSHELTRRFTVLYALAALAWFVSAFVPEPWIYGLWALGVGLSLTGGLSRHARELATRFPPDILHMTERYGLLTIIVLGESFVKVLTELASQGLDAGRAALAVMGMLVTCCLWWIYFDDVAGSRIKRSRLAPFVWVYAHLPLTIAITAVGVGIKKVVAVPDAADPIALKYRLLFTGTVALVLLWVGIIDAVTQRRQAELSDGARVKARVVFALLVLGTAFTGGFMPHYAFLASVTALLLGQVAFDISMAPLVVDHHHEALHEGAALFDGPDAPPAPLPDAPRRWDLEDVIRKGTPNELRRDLYFHFMQGSWSRVLGYFLALFVVSNGVFAALYLVDPGGVSGTDGRDFFDAFAFSVQTMSTIGYGAMSPVSDWAHAVSIIEAIVGLLGAAVSTGLVFAKASLPRNSVLFSDNLVITTRHGQPTLMLRAGNARASEIIEASVHMTVLIDEVSDEGHELRKLHDLELMRSTTPIFAVSWMIMHVIDEDSPLHGLTAENAADRVASFVVTLTGHDATYASATHARKLYYTENLRFGERFVDVLESRPDGRIVVDYGRFHDTRPDTTPA